MSFILRFQTGIKLSQAVTHRPLGERNSIVMSGTKTISEIRQESADNDPVTRRFEIFPKVTSR